MNRLPESRRFREQRIELPEHLVAELGGRDAVLAVAAEVVRLRWGTSARVVDLDGLVLTFVGPDSPGAPGDLRQALERPRRR